MKKMLLVCLILSLVSCAEKRPRFYPNAKYTAGGDYAAQAAADECMRQADIYVQEAGMAEEALKRGARGAGGGAAGGAVGGAIMKGKVGRATAAGAAIGGLVGIASGIAETSDHSQDYRNFVERCLQKKGYETIGWQ